MRLSLALAVVVAAIGDECVASAAEAEDGCGAAAEVEVTQFLGDGSYKTVFGGTFRGDPVVIKFSTRPKVLRKEYDKLRKEPPAAIRAFALCETAENALGAPFELVEGGLVPISALVGGDERAAAASPLSNFGEAEWCVRGETALRALAIFALWDATGWTFGDVGERNFAVDRSFEIRVIDGDTYGRGSPALGERRPQRPLASLKRAFVARMSKHPRLAALVEGWGKEGPTAAAARGAYLDVFRELGGPECAEAAAAADVAVFDAAYARIVRPNCGAASRQSPLETAPCNWLATMERGARRRAFCDGLALPRREPARRGRLPHHLSGSPPVFPNRNHRSLQHVCAT